MSERRVWVGRGAVSRCEELWVYVCPAEDPGGVGVVAAQGWNAGRDVVLERDRLDVAVYIFFVGIRTPSQSVKRGYGDHSSPMTEGPRKK